MTSTGPTRRMTGAALAVLLLFAFLQLGALVVSEDIPIVAHVLNAEPEVLDVRMVDQSGQGVISVDPGIPFAVKVHVRDNNTLADVLSIRLVLFSPDSEETGADMAAHHYTFEWTSGSGFGNVGGVGSLSTSDSSVPQDLSVGSDEWIFALTLERSASYSSAWRTVAMVYDEEGEGKRTASFGVNKYSAVRLGASEMTFTGSPGNLSHANENPIELRYSANHEASIGCWATPFVGTDRPDVVLDPSSFIVDDDGDPDPPEAGVHALSLSGTRTVLFDSLGPGEDLVVPLYLFVLIPIQFYDQEYQGSIYFDLS